MDGVCAQGLNRYDAFSLGVCCRREGELLFLTEIDSVPAIR